MTAIHRARLTVDYDRDFVVFLIGMRINRWLRPDLWFPTAMAMPRMMRELEGSTGLGYLGAESAFGNPTIQVMYWESPEALIDYARSQDHHHLPAWVEFKRRVATTDAVGVWHETYRIAPGMHESVYVNMPSYGLGKVGTLVPATGKRTRAAERLAVSSKHPAPIE